MPPPKMLVPFCSSATVNSLFKEAQVLQTKLHDLQWPLNLLCIFNHLCYL
jgi:hypothetical protein